LEPPPKWYAAHEERRDRWIDAFDFFRLALALGTRCWELLSLPWSKVSWDFGTVEVYSPKARKWRVLHAPAAVEVLRQRKDAGRGSAEKVFTCRHHSIRDALRVASEMCDIPYGQRVPSGWTIYDLRHVCLTSLLTDGCDLATVRVIIP